MKHFHIALSVKHEADGISQARIGERLCDALFVASIAFRTDGSISVMFYSFDGKSADGALTDSEFCRVWAFLAGHLMQRFELPAPLRELCQVMWEEWHRRFHTPREEPDVNHMYKLAYLLEPSPLGLSLNDVERRQVYASDAMVLVTLENQEMKLFSMDGITSESILDRMLWEVWAFLSMRIALSITVSEKERVLPLWTSKVIGEAINQEGRN